MKKIKIACSTDKTLSIDDLNDFQGELKTLSKDSYEKLRNEIISLGFSFPVNVWKNPKDKKHYIIDGHQRVRVVRQMMKIEGYKCDPIPVSTIEAKDIGEAKLKVLAGTSQYGKLEERGLYDFMKEANIGFERVAQGFEFPQINMPIFHNNFFEQKPGSSKQVSFTANDSEEEDELPEATAIKTLNIYIDQKRLIGFMEICEALQAKYKTDNLSETIIKAINEAHKIKK